MRKPRDYDSELKALQDKARLLQERKLRQFGELVVATGADALPIEQLAGALLAAADAPDMVRKEEWRARGAAFFRKTRRSPGSAAAAGAGSGAASDRSAVPAAVGPRAT
ncbi:MAG: conjugal transfer protein TraD [Allosphingosinicella sp.]|uniref:conjugal transfer protein TraD n=1 Tax=Allosphingosinicella sp. TaxID=2823234 RepID=UPI00392D597B